MIAQIVTNDSTGAHRSVVEGHVIVFDCLKPDRLSAFRLSDEIGALAQQILQLFRRQARLGEFGIDGGYRRIDLVESFFGVVRLSFQARCGLAAFG